MKRMICEICGSSDFIKENGLFLCQSCGAKYSLEEARKIMTDVDEETESTPEHASNDKKANGKMNKKLLVVAIIVIALAIAAVIAFSVIPSSKCGIEGCDEKQLENSEYCETHTCHADGCYNKVDGGEYCETHTCSYDGCTNYAANSTYCKEHTCKVNGCNDGISGKSSYCLTHKCKESDCNKKGSFDGYCKNHALNNSGLPSSFVDYAKYCGESTKEILENYTYGGTFNNPGSDLNGWTVVNRKNSAVFFLIEPTAPYEICYAEKNNPGAFLVWSNGAPASDGV